MAYRLPFSASTIPTGGTFGDRTPPRTAAHRGTDFSYLKGARGSIPSVCNGRVVAKGKSSIVGYWVEIQSTEGDGMFWTYCHNAGPSSVPIGTVLAVGQSVGASVGATGSAARGAHLHLALSRARGGGLSGAVQDPYAYIAARSSAAAGGNATHINPRTTAPLEENNMIFRASNGIVVALDSARGEYRALSQAELIYAQKHLPIEDLSDAVWSETFAPLRGVSRWVPQDLLDQKALAAIKQAAAAAPAGVGNAPTAESIAKAVNDDAARRLTS